MLTRLFDTAPEALRRIALFTVYTTDKVYGPPREFLNLGLVCRASYKILTMNSAPLYTEIFAANFDIAGPIYRLGKPTVQNNSKRELERRFTALKIFRGGDLDHPGLTDAFWVAYMMFEDSDSGQKNGKHLLDAGLLGYLNKYLRSCLYRGSESNNGWPIPNEQNSLAVTLFWLASAQSEPSPLPFLDALQS
ncbi:hypothetical protein H0H81_012356 [Sphagnurus paluster]|uniref:Uncharacterized protein n=1 Tax=Sphagnurus paluster TaxID=117069 RepID=A0A9P7GV83_9AGAR|nr:hypothetical protein H0H81_012356 [Sphagnurus paluster]